MQPPRGTPASLQADFRYIPALDSLRAVSILIVLAAHFGLDHLVPGGLGVTIFFFISGFLITRLLLAQQMETGTVSIARFYARRFLRLMPAVYVAVLTASIVLPTIGDPLGVRDVAAALFYYMNYRAIFTTDPHTALTIFWSLAVEEHFYFFYPLTLFLLARRPHWFAAAIVAALVLAPAWRFALVRWSVPADYTYMATDARLDSILYGALLTVVATQPWGRRLVLALGQPVAFGFGVAGLLLSLMIRNPEFRETARYSLQGITLLPIVSGLAFSPRLCEMRRLMTNRVAIFIGKISYSLYLWHLICLSAAQWLFPNAAVQILAAASLSAAAATTSYYLIELPFAQLRRRLGSRAAAEVTSTFPAPPATSIG